MRLAGWLPASRFCAGWFRFAWTVIGEGEKAMNGELGSAEETSSDPEGGAGRMWSLLQDLLEVHGRDGTAELLGVSERTLRRAESNRHVTAQLQKELERHAEAVAGDSPSPQEVALELANLKSRFDGLERGTQEAVDGLRQEVAEVVAENEALRNRVNALEQRGGGGAAGTPGASDEADSGQPPTTHSTLAERDALDRRYPQLVTEEAEAGEQSVYGMAMPVITEWRAQRGAFLDAPDAWSKLTSELRMTELEIELIDAHVLTLPPADYPWDGIRRHSELRLRRRTLERLQGERRQAQVRRWLLRLATLGWRGR